MLRSLLSSSRGFKPSVGSIRSFSELTPVYTRQITESFYSLPFGDKNATQLPPFPKPSLPSFEDNNLGDRRFLDENGRSWVEIDWSIVDNEEFMLFMQGQYDGVGGKSTQEIDVEKDGKEHLETFGGNCSLLKDCSNDFIKAIFSIPGRNDILNNPFTWIYALIENCKKGETLRIATFSDVDSSAWLLIKDALDRGVNVKFVADSNCQFEDNLASFIKNLMENYPKFELKQKPRKIGKKIASQHDKIYLSNGWLITGSINMSVNDNYQSGIVTNNEELISSFTTYFDDQIWKNYSLY